MEVLSRRKRIKMSAMSCTKSRRNFNLRFRNNKLNKGRSNLSSRFDLQITTIGLQGILPLTPYQCRMRNYFQHYWLKDSFRQEVLQILQTVPHHGIRLTSLVPIIRGHQVTILRTFSLSRLTSND